MVKNFIIKLNTAMLKLDGALAGQICEAYIMRCKLTRKLQIRITVLVYITTILISFTLPVFGQVQASTISEGFQSISTLRVGSVVSITEEDPDLIELTSIGNSDLYRGVVTEVDSSLLAINSGTSTVQVALEGETGMLVSTLNGPINRGDKLGPSWLAGVAMKAQDNGHVFAVALESFSEDATDIDVVEGINTPTGTKNAHVGQIGVRLIASGSLDGEVGGESSALERLAQRIAGKEVAYARILAATGLFTISAIIGAVFLANAIRGSFISLGRNPLASQSIFASLLQISGVAVALVLMGSFVAYLVLIV